MVQRVVAWIRHGEFAQPPGVPSAHLPHGLTALGREQARAAAHAVWQHAQRHGLSFDGVVDCSRLRRAWETADVMAHELERLGGPKLVVQEFDALAERSLGSAANLTVEQIETVIAADPRYETPPAGWKRDAHYVLPLPGAESLAQAGARVARHVVARLRELGSGSWLKLFVGHGGAFRHAARELGLLSSSAVQQLSMQYGAPIFFELRAEEAGGERFVQIAGDWRRREAAAPAD